jgi:hypothetical protein
MRNGWHGSADSHTSTKPVVALWHSQRCSSVDPVANLQNTVIAVSGRHWL